MPEQERRGANNRPSNISLSFLGYEHQGENVQGTLGLTSEIHSQLDQASGPIVLVFENATSTSRGNATYKENIKKYGFRALMVAHAVTRRTGVTPNSHQFNEVIARMDDLTGGYGAEISAQTIQRVTNSRLLVAEDLQNYFLADGLDAAMRRHPFAVEQEWHSPGVSMSEVSFTRQGEDSLVSVKNSWQSRRFEEAVGFIRMQYSFHGKAREVRHRENIDHSKDLVRNMQKKDRGFLGFVFGRSHLTLPEGVRKRIGPKFNPQMLTTTPELSVYSKPTEDLRAGNAVSDQQLAQSFLAGLLRDNVRGIAHDRGQLAIFAMEYETVVNDIDAVAAMTPLERIREICERQESAVLFLRVHPNVRSAGRYL